jgi:hypothetical protein
MHTDTDKCEQCGKPMNPVSFMMGPVCLECCRANHKKVVEPDYITKARENGRLREGRGGRWQALYGG